MRAFDILKLLSAEYTTLELDIKSAKRLEADNKVEKAAERYRLIARNCLKLRQYTFAVDYYSLASDLFIEAGNYLKAISSELTIYEIHRISYNLNEMASSYEKIASFYTYFAKDDATAGWYYFLSAKYHEENINYPSAFKKARFACDCFENISNSERKRNAHSLAFRMALQAGYVERAGIYAQKWLSLMPKDYSSHYVSVCLRGYKSFWGTERSAEALMFVNEIIIAHYEKGRPQEQILKYLRDAMKLYISDKQDINDGYNTKILAEYGGDSAAIIKYSIEFRSFCQGIGLSDLSDFFYLQENRFKKQLFLKERRHIQFIGYWLWDKTCVYGTNFKRWLYTSLFIIVLFGLLYFPFNSIFHSSSWISGVLQVIKPAVKVSGVDNWFSPFYYSVTTFTTLGYGDIVPSNLSGQIFSVVEVLIGYLMLGGLLSVFSKKMIR